MKKIENSFLSFPLCWWKKLDRLFELVFFIYVSGFRLKFSRIAPLRKRLQLDSKSDLTTNGLILDYFVGIWFPWLTSYLYGLKFAWIAQVCFSFDDIKSFRWLVWVVFWSVLKNCPFLSAIEFFKIDWWDLTMHFNFTLYLRVSSSVSFVASVDEITTNSSENHIDRFPNFFKVNSLLIFYSVYCKSFFFQNNNRAFYCNCSSVAPLLPEIFFWLTETRKNLNILCCIHVLTVFWCSTSYTAIIVLWKTLVESVNALARWWPCACLKCVSGLRRLERTLNFLRCIHAIDLVLKHASDINERIWYSFSFTSLYWWV